MLVNEDTSVLESVGIRKPWASTSKVAFNVVLFGGIRHCFNEFCMEEYFILDLPQLKLKIDCDQVSSAPFLSLCDHIPEQIIESNYILRRVMIIPFINQFLNF
jgi:hypothetical protein